jgi:hypothetical protein
MLLGAQSRTLAERRIGLLPLDIHESVLRRRGLDPGILRQYVRDCGYRPSALYYWVWEVPAGMTAPQLPRFPPDLSQLPWGPAPYKRRADSRDPELPCSF